MKNAHAARNAVRVRSSIAMPMNTGNNTDVNRPVPSSPLTSAIAIDASAQTVNPTPNVRLA